MLILKDVKVTINGKTSKLKALFDTGSSFTIMGYQRLMELFKNVKIKVLAKPREAALINGQKIVIDGYIDAEILIEDHYIVTLIYLSKNIPKEVVIEGKRIPLPDLIIGAPTLETWGLELDLKTGKIIKRGCFII